jgi:peptide/nickel transport system substrate-binding protein
MFPPVDGGGGSEEMSLSSATENSESKSTKHLKNHSKASTRVGESDDGSQPHTLSRRASLGTLGLAMATAGCLGSSGDGASENTSDGSDSQTVLDETQDPDVSVPERPLAQGGTIVCGVMQPPNVLNILRATNPNADLLLDLIYDYGITTDPVTHEWKPWVYTDWELQKQDTEQPEIVFDVRDDLVFTDGEPCGVEDVLFSWQYLNEQEPIQSSAWQTYEWTRTDDGEWDVRAKMTEQIGAWEERLLADVPTLPKHVWEGVGDDWQDHDPFEKGGPVGTGPGVVTEFRPDTAIILDLSETESGREDYEYPLTRQDWYVEHDAFVGNGPHLQRIRWRPFGSMSYMKWMEQAVRRGEVDTVTKIKNPTVETLRDDDDFQLITCVDSGFSYADWNHRREPLNDICLRQAMAFAWDEFFWVERLNEGLVLDGDIPYTPGYTTVRPESVFGTELLEDAAVEAFTFRAESDGSPEPDIEGIREFLENGEIIDGTAGTYVGTEYPGSLSGVEASYSEAQFDYSFEPAESSLLRGKGIEQELSVDGEPFSEFYDHGDRIQAKPMAYQNNPHNKDAWGRWAENVRKVGIPMEVDATARSELSGNIPYEAEYDIYDFEWKELSPNGNSVPLFLHSRFSNESVGEQQYSTNRNGYGNHEQYRSGTADDLIEEARTTFDTDKRREQWAKALERAYLDVALMPFSYDIVHWPLPSWARGAIEGLVDPTHSSWKTQMLNIYDEREQ